MNIDGKYSLNELIKYCTNVFSLNTNDYQRSTHIQIKEQLLRLLELETKIKNGNCLELKAPLGSKVYTVEPLWMYDNRTHFETPHVTENTVIGIQKSNSGLEYILNNKVCMYEDDFGYSTFTNYEEAESVCEELKREIKMRKSNKI